MKKIIALVLSALVLLSGMTCILLTPAAAVELSNDAVTAYFENPENWHKGKVSSNVATYNDTWTYGSFTKEDTVTTGAESAHSLKVSLASHAPIIELPSLLNQNTEYTLSFRYKADDPSYWTQWGSSSNYWIFSTIGIYSQTAAGSTGYDVSLGTPKDGYLSRRGSFDAVNYTSATGKAADNVTSTPLRVSGLNTGEWYTVSLTFNSGTFSDLALVLRLDKCSTLYLDDFTLTARESKVAEYFENPGNWSADKAPNATKNPRNGFTNGNYVLIGSNDDTNLKFSNDTANVYPSDGTQSLYMNKISYRAATIALPSDLKANTDYTLSFWYYGNQDNVFSSVGIFAPEASDFAATDPKFVYLTSGASFNGWLHYKNASTDVQYLNGKYTETANKTIGTEYTTSTASTWKNLSFSFNTGSFSELYLILKSDVMADSTWSAAYLDHFTLTASESKVAKYFENPENWSADKAPNATKNPRNGFTNGNYVLIGSNDDTNLKFSNDTANVYPSDGTQSLYMNKISYRAATIALPSDLKANTDYTLSFWYYGNQDNVFSSVGIFAPEASDFAATDPKFVYLTSGASFNGWLHYKNATTDVQYLNGKYTETANKTIGTEYTNSTASTWKNLSFSFNTGSFSELYLILKSDVMADSVWSAAYLDHFSLQKASDKTDEDPKDIEYFEDDINWVKEKVHASDTYGRDSVITVGAGFPTYGSILTDSEVTTGSDSKYSLMVAMAYHGASIDLSSQIEANKHYELTFKYRVTDAAQFGSWSNKPYVFQSIGVYSPSVGGADAVINHNIVDGYVAKKSIYDYSSYTSTTGKVADNVEITSNTLLTSADVNTWYQMTLQFYSGDFDDLVLLLKLNAAAPVYLDDFCLAEYTPPPPKEPFHSGPKDYILIDFEKEEEYIRGNSADRMEIAETTDKNGKTTKALHVIGGDYTYINKDAVTILNWGYANKGTDPVFSIPVKARTTYEMRVKVRVDEVKNFMTDSPFLLYYDYWGERIRTLEFAHTPYNKLMGKGWIEYAVEFVTDYGQETANFFLNAGVKHPDIWIDDIELIEYGRGYLDDTDASYCENFYNLADESGYAIQGTITKKTVMEVPVADFEKHTLGIDLSGSGTVTLAFEKDGSDAIWSTKVDTKNKRYGVNFMAGDKEGSVYLIFEPTGSGIRYRDLYLFRAKAVSFLTEMGMTQNPNAMKNPNYKIKYVSATAALGNDETVDVESPATGHSLVIPWILSSIVLACGGVLLVLGKKRRQHD